MSDKTKIWTDIEAQMPEEQAKLALAILKLVQESNGKPVPKAEITKAAQAVYDETKGGK